MKYCNLSPDKLLAELETDFEVGLTSEQAEQRLKKDGQNFRVRYGADKNKSRFYRAAFFSLLSVVVYLLAALFKRDLNCVYCAAFMLTVCAASLLVCRVLLHAVGKNSGSSPLGYGSLTVLRDGKETRCRFRQITYGDVVLLKKGDYIPFDARVLSSDGLETDETAVTGMRSSIKRPGVIEDENPDASEQYNTVFSSSYVVSGTGKVVVTDISERVYVKRSRKSASRDKKLAARVADFSRMLSLLLFAVGVLSALVGALFGSAFLGFALDLFVFAAAFLSDFVSAFIYAAFNRVCALLFKRGIYVKSLSDIETLNSCDINLLRYNELFDNIAEITGFVSGGEYRLVSELNKNNFSVFLYSGFCNESAGEDSPYFSLKKLTHKLLRGVGVDYEDIFSMCPVLSAHHSPSGTCDVCGIVYDGSNVLIARGDHTDVLRLCAQSREDHAELIDRLSRNSTEIIAVAVKQMDVIPDDLSSETDGFSLVGFIGLKRNFSQKKLAQIARMERFGVHNLVLFSGGESSARSLSLGADTRYADCADTDFMNCDIAYGFDGDMEAAAERCIAAGLSPVYRGKKTGGSGVAFGSVDEPLLDSRDNEFVSDGSFESVMTSLELSRSVFSAVRELLINAMTFTFTFALCAIVLGIAFGSAIPAAPFTALAALLALPSASLAVLLTERDRGLGNTGAFSKTPLQKRVILIPAAASLLILLCSMIFPGTAPGFAAVALSSFFPLTVFDIKPTDRKSIIALAASYLPSIICAVLLASPLGALAGIPGFGALQAVFAVLSGALIKYVCAVICRSVKN